MGIIKKIDTIITVVGAAVSTYQLMTKTFKWYERKYGKGKDKKDITDEESDCYLIDHHIVSIQPLSNSYFNQKVYNKLK